MASSLSLTVCDRAGLLEQQRLARSFHAWPAISELLGTEPRATPARMVSMSLDVGFRMSSRSPPIAGACRLDQMEALVSQLSPPARLFT